MPNVKADIEEQKAAEKREANKIRKRRNRLKQAYKKLEEVANGRK